MALKYVASNKTYDFGKSEYTTTSNKYKRLNYIANGKTYQLGLATDSTATQYSPLKMKINDSTYYIGRSSSRSTSNSYVSTYSSRYLAYKTCSFSTITIVYDHVRSVTYDPDSHVGEYFWVQTEYTHATTTTRYCTEYSTTTVSSSASSVTTVSSNNFV